MKRNFIVLTMVFLIIPVSFAVGQQPIHVKGTVIDRDTREPISNVSVYLANTFLGAATDANGEYTIYNVPPGSYEMVAAHIAYDVRKRRVRLVREQLQKYSFSLKQKALSSKEVVVTGKLPKDWKKNLKRFTKEFLGSTDNAKKCEIINPEVLSFIADKSSKEFAATAEDLLIVENRALGYRVSMLLEKFLLDNKYLRYTVKPYFEKLEPKDDKERRKWDENLLRTYKGSLRHFLSALCLKRTVEEGFFVYRMERLPEEVTLTTTAIPPHHSDGSELLKPAGMPFERNLEFNDVVQVIYTGKVLDREYALTPLYGGSKDFYPNSWMALNTGRALVNNLGYLYNEEVVLSFGYWSLERVAELLPFEYNPLVKQGTHN